MTGETNENPQQEPNQNLATGSSMLVFGLYSVATGPGRAGAGSRQKPADDDDLEAVVVTGSRIAGVAPVGATVTTLGRVEIENSSQVTLDRMIQ